MRARLRGHSIALPIFLLVIGAILVATAITFTVSLRGPPPRAAPIAVDDLAAALRGGSGRDPGIRRLMAIDQAAAPSPRAGEHPEPRRIAAIATEIGRQPADLRGYFDERGMGPDSAIRGGFTVGVRKGVGWRVVQTTPDTQLTKWMAVTGAAMLAAMAVLAGIAWWVARAISRPLRRLARAAGDAQVGGGTLARLDEGPREVIALSDALATMHDRLAAHAGNRTAMLAAIAHDLGTPLSRVAFWIEQLPEAARVRAAGDIEEMRAMLGDVLRFARDERSTAVSTIDLGSVLDALVDDLSVAGQPVTLVPDARVLVRGDPQGLRRLFANLVENAIRYGEVARVGWDVVGERVAVTIDDEGPGFAPDHAERLFEPFVRGDPSRSRATGGTGLGLAIVRSLAEAHGGSVTLGRHDGGGRVTVTLPRV